MSGKDKEDMNEREKVLLPQIIEGMLKLDEQHQTYLNGFIDGMNAKVNADGKNKQ